MRKARSFKSVAIGAGFLALVVLGVMFALYLRYVRYERVAARHLPVGTVLAVRVDVEQAVFYEPIRRHILPLFGGPGDSPTQADARLARIEARSRLKRGDLREIVVARGATRSDWAVVLGGIFPRGSDRLVTALCDEPGWIASADRSRAEHGPTGTAVGRAEDGAVVIASSRDVLAAAVTPTDTFEVLGLSLQGAGGLALSRAGLGELARWGAVLAAGDLPVILSELDGVAGVLSPGERILLTTTFRASNRDVAEKAARGLVEVLRARSGAGESRESSLLKATLDRYSIRNDASGTLLLLEWERPEVDYALAALADTIRSRW